MESCLWAHSQAVYRMSLRHCNLQRKIDSNLTQCKDMIIIEPLTVETVLFVVIILMYLLNRTATGQSFTITTVKSEEYTFTSVNGEEICQLVNYFLDGLRKRSKYVIAMMDYQSPGQ